MLLKMLCSGSIVIYIVVFKLVDFKESFKLVHISIILCVLQGSNYVYLSLFILLKHNRSSTSLCYYLMDYCSFKAKNVSLKVSLTDGDSSLCLGASLLN